jgi:hypothetical protein
METIWKRQYILGLYFSILLVLLLCVSSTPLLIRNGISISDHFIIEEEVLETVLILFLFGISFMVLVSFANHLKAYQQRAKQAVHDKSKLVSRLTEAFRYIGRLNTVFILPASAISKEETVLLTAILNQIEMLFILHRAGCIKPLHVGNKAAKEIDHGTAPVLTGKA